MATTMMMMTTTILEQGQNISCGLLVEEATEGKEEEAILVFPRKSSGYYDNDSNNMIGVCHRLRHYHFLLQVKTLTKILLLHHLHPQR
eukprot:3205561-Ditylum_brightwellii.AAC.1